MIDLDLRGSRADIAARLAAAAGEPPGPPRGRGRPKLGVVAREVTLRRATGNGSPPSPAAPPRRCAAWSRRRGAPAAPKDRARLGQEAAYRFMAAMAGDLPGFEEATRALFAKDRLRFERHVAQWPDDVGAYAAKLAEPALA